jgi:hypothetical protein
MKDKNTFGTLWQLFNFFLFEVKGGCNEIDFLLAYWEELMSFKEQ